MNYKKKYNKLVEAIKVLQETNPSDEGIHNWVNDNVPELHKSEDEKIRKGLITMLSQDRELHSKEIAWLEKQGEHANFLSKIQIGDKVTRNKDGVLVNLSQLKRVAKPAEKQGMNLVEEEMTPFQKKVFCIIDTTIEEEQGLKQVCDELFALASNEIKQKPAWSEEDENLFRCAIDAVEQESKVRTDGCLDEEVGKMVTDWLKSLKERVQPQPKQKWNEEDINMIDWLIRCCEKEHEELCNDKYGHQDIVSDLKRDCRKKWDWLESLKNRVAPQKQWKPSDEQIKAVKEAACYSSVFSEKIIDNLISLSKQLKKLKE